MSRIQDVDFCSRHIVGIGCRPGDAEGRIVFSPDRQHFRLYFAKPLLPTRIGGDVGPVIQEQRGLDVCPARAGKKRASLRDSAQIGQSNIFSLLFFEVTLFLKFFSLIMVWPFWTRNPYGYWAFENLIANLRIYSRFSLVFFPVTRFWAFRDRFTRPPRSWPFGVAGAPELTQILVTAGTLSRECRTSDH